MNRTDRLLAIILELQAHHRRRAEDLAATFETSKRTIYRDIQALCETGVPIVSAPGQGYSLVEGYFLPPLRFSPEEALMLLLGGDVAAQNFDSQYRAAALSATRKIQAVLPESMRAEIQGLRKNIRFVSGGDAAPGAAAELLPPLRRALVEHKTVRFYYHARSHGSAEWREADPYALAHVHGSWYVLAADHARGELRRFRLERMEKLLVTDKSFAPADVKMDQPADDASRTLTIRARFDPTVARWVKESRFYFVVAEEEDGEGLVVTLRVRDASEALPWLLGWGSRVRVLEPESVREQMRTEAEAIILAHPPLLT